MAEWQSVVLTLHLFHRLYNSRYVDNISSSSALINLPVGNVTSIQFDYEAVKHRYNRRRTVILPRVA